MRILLHPELELFLEKEAIPRVISVARLQAAFL